MIKSTSGEFAISSLLVTSQISTEPYKILFDIVLLGLSSDQRLKLIRNHHAVIG